MQQAPAFPNLGEGPGIKRPELLLGESEVTTTDDPEI